jgi:isorenieratene synthase
VAKDPEQPSETPTRISRRTLLKAGAATSAAALVGGTGAAYAGRARPVLAVEPEPDRPAKLAGSSKVAVVGGGLAGLSAAIELAERGFEVDLFESGATCGGRVGGFDTRVLGEPMTLEHGFHGFFFQYYNLRDLIARTADTEDYLPLDAYPVVPRGKPPDVLRPNTLPFPLNMFSVVAESQNIDFLSVSRSGASHVLAMLGYDPERTYARYDDRSFEAFCREHGVPDALYHNLYEPYVRTLFMRPDEISAAEVLKLFHSYFIANPEGMGMDVLRRPAPHALIDPLIRHLEAHGGRVHTSAPVHALHIEDGAVRGLIRRVAGEPRTVARLALSDVPDEVPHPVVTTDGPAFVRRTADGISAMSAVCTHMGCPIGRDPEGPGFLCPCHGGRYDATGRPTGGPPKARLAQLEAVVEDEELMLRSTAGSAEELIAADHVILATDVRGVQAIVGATEGWPDGVRDLRTSIESLEVTRPYSVGRHWLDVPLREDRHPIYTTGGFEYLDELFLYSQFQEDAIAWARRTGGSVIETHCYALPDHAVGDPEQVHTRALAEASTIVPELAGAKVLHREVQLLQNFSAYGVGQQARRPTTETSLPGLLLAGDWVRIDLPLELMERATVSGRLAANAVLQREGVRRVEVRTPPLRGILA